MKTLMRILFVFVPAALVGVPVALFSLPVGLMLFAAIAWFGWGITTPKADRGES